MGQINEIWQDIVSGKIPLMFDSTGIFQQGLSSVSKYSNYEAEESGTYDFEGSTIQEAANKAWNQVWKEKKSGKLCRAFTVDYESTVPSDYTKDGKAHCYL